MSLMFVGVKKTNELGVFRISALELYKCEFDSRYPLHAPLHRPGALRSLVKLMTHSTCFVCGNRSKGWTLVRR